MTPRRPWSWHGAVALVIAVCVGVGWAAALILASTPWTDTISDKGADLLTAIGGVLAGAVATYLGAAITRSARRDADDAPPPHDEGGE